MLNKCGKSLSEDTRQLFHDGHEVFLIKKYVIAT